MPSPTHIAILGGGVTGLSSAFHLSRRFPHALITLIEAGASLGGWVQSERVHIDRDTSVVLESGPRTLRPTGKSVLELINLLGLRNELVLTHRNSPVAHNKFLHEPGIPGIQQIPLPMSKLLIGWPTPMRILLIRSLVAEVLRAPNRPRHIDDESVDAFLTRRFNPEFARLFGSAVVHGIFAADSRQLSVRGTFPLLWRMEERGMGSLLRGLLFSPDTDKCEDDAYDLGDIASLVKETSVYSFRDGMATLPRALESHLSGLENVKVLRNTRATHLTVNGVDGSIELGASDGLHISPSHVVSALPLPVLAQILSPSAMLPHLTDSTASSVTVMSFVFRSSRRRLHPPGFGYLVPRPRGGYRDLGNPAGILATMFESSTLGAQDSCELTKLTVMLGGPYMSHATSPQEVLDALGTHLWWHGFRRRGRGRFITRPEPVYVRTQHHEGCIPTYALGHVQRMERLRAALKAGPWHGRLKVIGAYVGGISVPECVEAGRMVGTEW
ncbi:Protoporphyrinogen oxidase [Fistulina hepatica ATCC 64428]|nr:Protoporphyrinogen oxidase [Fistulina hepatica ATCC 64428]